MREVVKDALNMLRRGLPSSLEIESRIDDAPVLVLADPNQIHQVLMNLGTNAAHAMHSTLGTMTPAVNMASFTPSHTTAPCFRGQFPYAGEVVERDGVVLAEFDVGVEPDPRPFEIQV